jgi:vacuolar-type H+-ATPase subunit H
MSIKDQEFLVNVLAQERFLSKKYPENNKNEQNLLSLKEELENRAYFDYYQLIDPEGDFTNDIVYNYSAISDTVEVLISEDLILDCVVNKLENQGYDDLFGILNTKIITQNQEPYSGYLRIIKTKDNTISDKDIVDFEHSNNDTICIEDARREYKEVYKLFEDFANKLYSNLEETKTNVRDDIKNNIINIKDKPKNNFKV